ncbi:hypothetical protein NEHOM01_1780 [Nematocida homosporus]|uniref:uncharacterized protein n=1 Tax=Nematocida homosporus TaxID=1912981 RepID=UPI00221F035D|nr:uncharacterized protein NEHOM01_1780 [Nematocida homosporus]KAI5186891.1 hypothetical protein NEHOM01_1780 [Nematocida homosporus]
MANDVVAAYFNLLKTIVGGGIVGFPMFFVVFGIVPTLVFSLISAVLTFFGLMMLCDCAEYTQSKEKTFSASLQKICPRLSVWFNAVVFVKCFGVSISYLITIKPLLAYLFSGLLGRNVSPEILVICFGLGIIPLCIMRDLKSLRFTSVLGIFGALVCIVGSVLNFMTVRQSSNGSTPATYWAKTPEVNWIRSAGQFIFTFTCHQNIFGIRAEILTVTRNKMARIIAAALGSAMAIYLVFSTVIYFTYGDAIKSNVFESFVDGGVKYAIFVFYVALITFSYPLQIYPARDCLSEWIGTILGKADSKVLSKKGVRVLATLFLVVIGLGVAMFDIDITTVQSCVGGSASMLMCNVIPCISLYSLPRRKTPTELLVCSLLLIYGMLSLVGVYLMLTKAS